MPKIIQITDTNIYIGTESGGIKEVKPTDLSFSPSLGDEVEIFESETKTIVIKNGATLEKVSEGNTKVTPVEIGKNDYNQPKTAQPYANAYVVKSRPVNKVIYLVFAFLLGGFGAHKFYAGKPTAGWLYLIFCWTGIPLLISFVDLIVGLFSKSDINGNIYP